MTFWGGTGDDYRSFNKKEYRALGLPETDDPGELISRMAAQLQIIERPIVFAGRKACLGRATENVLEIL